MLRSRLVQLILVTLVVTGWFAFADRVLAIQDSEDKVWFGPIGVGVGQSVRVNVYGLSSHSAGSTVPLPTAPWEFTVKVFNRRGDIAQQRQFQVASGAIASLEINIGNPDEFPVDRLGRRTLRAEIVGFNPQPDPPGKFAATLEVYSVVTGHTSVFVGNPDSLPAMSPPPDPELTRQ
jgi:hypothetical protein